MTDRKRRKGLKADYGDATPEQVAKALHAYRPPSRNSDPESVDVSDAAVQS